ncbi:hypothetical protein D3C78_1575760 [compost metagenome]
MGLQWSFFEIADRANASVVDPDIDPSAAKCCCLRSQRLHLVVAGDIGRDRYGIRPAVGAFVQDVEQRLFIARGKHQTSTLAGKCVRGGTADTAGSASDDHDFAAQRPSARIALSGRFPLFARRSLVVN